MTAQSQDARRSESGDRSFAPTAGEDSAPEGRQHPDAAATNGRSGVALSVVIPAYNESVRLPPYLRNVRRHMDADYAQDYEVIVVDDGSSDQLPARLENIAQDWSQLKWIRHVRNSGKGAAVRSGVLEARGGRVLYADADGATPIEEERKLRAALDAGADVAAGSRLLPCGDVVRKRTWQRALIGRVFASVARQVVPLPVRDTQCGFKMLDGARGRRLFQRAQERGYLFDIEILALAVRCGYRVVEVPINWSDQPGSQLNMRHEACRIMSDLWRVRRRISAVQIEWGGGDRATANEDDTEPG